MTHVASRSRDFTEMNLNIQIYWAVLIAVCFSILTIIGFAFWRNKTMEKPIDHPFKDNFEMSENDDERANVVSFNLFLFNTTVNLYKLRKSPSVTLLIQ